MISPAKMLKLLRYILRFQIITTGTVEVAKDFISSKNLASNSVFGRNLTAFETMAMKVSSEPQLVTGN